MVTITVEDDDEIETRTVKHTVKAGAYLTLCPGKSEMSGFGAPGDSGGPLFFQNKLVGVYHTGIDTDDEKIVCPMSFCNGPHGAYYREIYAQFQVFVDDNPDEDPPIKFMVGGDIKKCTIAPPGQSDKPPKESSVTLLNNYSTFINDTLEKMRKILAN